MVGRPVMTGVRLQYYTAVDYDHIVPFYGVCSDNISPGAPLNSAADGFSFTTDYGVRRILVCCYGYECGVTGAAVLVCSEHPLRRMIDGCHGRVVV